MDDSARACPLRFFSLIPDPRATNVRHRLIDILVMAFAAVLCDADGWDDIEDFVKAKDTIGQRLAAWSAWNRSDKCSASIPSRKPCHEGAAAMLEATRAHWGIENKVHWCLDMVFGEDRSRVHTGHAAENLSRFRRLALTLVRRMQQVKPNTSLKARRLMCAWDRQTLLDVLCAMP